jgi:hypothetical protein
MSDDEMIGEMYAAQFDWLTNPQKCGAPLPFGPDLFTTRLRFPLKCPWYKL